MAETGFLAPRPMRPATLGLVVLAHVAVLGAVIVAKGPEIVAPRDVIKVDWIDDLTDPPPLPPPPPTPAPPSPSRIDTPRRLIESEVAKQPALPVFPTIDPTPTRTIEPYVPPQPPAGTPVFVDAAPDARYAGSFQPAYPPAQMRAEVEGRAVVRVLVGSDGRVHAVEIVSADDPAFAEATRRQALKAWRFKPALRDGVAVESWRTMTVRFRLEA